MIKIHADEDKKILTVTGHAGYAPKGEDIVCAGVSALVQTLGLYAMEHGGKTEIREGYAKIDAGNGSGEVFSAIVSGLRKMSENYGGVWFS